MSKYFCRDGFLFRKNLTNVQTIILQKMNDSKMKGELGVNPNMEFAIKTAQAYNAVCKPLCQELEAAADGPFDIP